MSEVKLTIQKLIEDKKVQLGLTLLAGENGLDRRILRPVLHRPSLLFAGYCKDFASKRIQIIGKTEMNYLDNLSRKDSKRAIESLFSYPIPAVIITRGLMPGDDMINTAKEQGVPLMVSRLSTESLFTRASAYLDLFFSPSIGIHGTMVDVHGVGILYTGSAGIGKSECALSLIEKGHRLVADDVVRIRRRAGEVLIATSESEAGYHLEIRGVGIVDIEKLFGIRAVRMRKRVEIQVHLEMWESTKDYERLGLDETFTTILGIKIPKMTIPVSPGKNITAISEVIAMNHMLKIYGHHPAQEFVNRMSEIMKRRQFTDQYLESDFE